MAGHFQTCRLRGRVDRTLPETDFWDSSEFSVSASIGEEIIGMVSPATSRVEVTVHHGEPAGYNKELQRTTANGNFGFGRLPTVAWLRVATATHAAWEVRCDRYG